LANTIRSEAKFCCRVHLNGGHIAGISAGPGERLLVLVSMGERDENWIDRRSACDWRVLSIAPSGACDEYHVRNQRDNFNLVQPLPSGMLLATRRCEFSEHAVRPNGKVFDLDGKILRSLVLGDGIHDLQATESGLIWASYFDEGVFGNLEWTHPIGSCGLRQFDDRGDHTYEFKPVSGLDAIDDCYALNVTSNDEAWCYYYSQFPIVRIQDRRIVQHWVSPISGASGLCIGRDAVLMQGGYQSDEWKLLHLANDGTVRIEASFEFFGTTGQVLRSSTARARGESIWFAEGEDVYHVSLRDLAG
jgi:hypothetical protein